MSDNTHPIHVSCPVCEEAFDAPASFKGQKIECPICLSPVLVPNNTSTTPNIKKEQTPSQPISSNEEISEESKSIDTPTAASKPNASAYSEEDNTTVINFESNEEPSFSANVQSFQNLESGYLPDKEITDEEEDLPFHPKESDKSPEDLDINDSGIIKTSVTKKQPSKLKTWSLVLLTGGGILMLIGAGVIYSFGTRFLAKIGQTYSIAYKFIDNEYSKAGGVSKMTNQQIEAMKIVLNNRSQQINKTRLFLQENKIISDSELAQIKQMLVNYSQESDPDKKLGYVHSPETVQKDLQSWDHKDFKDKISVFNIVNEYIITPTVILLKLESDGEAAQALFVKNEETKKWLLDWYSVSGFSPLSYDQLTTTKPEEPVEVRAIARMDVQYSNEFPRSPSAESYDHKAYLNISLELPDGNLLNAYIDRLNPDALELTKALKQGGVKVLVSVYYPKDLVNNDSVIISKLNHIGWHSKKTESLIRKAMPSEQ